VGDKKVEWSRIPHCRAKTQAMTKYYPGVSPSSSENAEARTQSRESGGFSTRKREWKVEVTAKCDTILLH
jgi:hypothetical protein